MDAGWVMTLPESVIVGPGTVVVVGMYEVLQEVIVTSRSVVTYEVWTLN